MKNNFTVYIHELPDGRKYVGLTSNCVEARWSGGNGYKNNKRFFNAILEFGWNNIKHIVVASELSVDEACMLEIQLIREFNTLSPKYGFNVSDGGRAKANRSPISNKFAFNKGFRRVRNNYNMSVSEFANYLGMDVHTAILIDEDAYVPNVIEAAEIATKLNRTINNMLY